MDAQDTLFALEPLLLAQLEAKLANLTPRPKVLTAADLAGVSENQQFTPAVHLVYQGYRVVESPRADGTAARIEQDWLCIVATRSQKAIRAGDAARSEAGVLARRVCAAMMGFKPTPASKPLKIASGPNAGYSAGFQYLPLAFTAEIVLTPQRTAHEPEPKPEPENY